MIYDVTEFEESFNDLLQQDIAIMLNGKVLRRGRLVLFAIKNFYLVFSILQNKDSAKLTQYELPIPFYYTKINNKYNLSYKVTDFYCKDSDIELSSKLLTKTKYHKLYDKNIVIETLLSSE